MQNVGVSAWESNPPETVLTPHSGFEVTVFTYKKLKKRRCQDERPGERKADLRDPYRVERADETSQNVVVQAEHAERIRTPQDQGGQISTIHPFGGRYMVAQPERGIQ